MRVYEKIKREKVRSRYTFLLQSLSQIYRQYFLYPIFYIKLFCKMQRKTRYSKKSFSKTAAMSTALIEKGARWS